MLSNVSKKPVAPRLPLSSSLLSLSSSSTMSLPSISAASSSGSTHSSPVSLFSRTSPRLPESPGTFVSEDMGVGLPLNPTDAHDEDDLAIETLILSEESMSRAPTPNPAYMSRRRVQVWASDDPAVYVGVKPVLPLTRIDRRSFFGKPVNPSPHVSVKLSPLMFESPRQSVSPESQAAIEGAGYNA